MNNKYILFIEYLKIIKQNINSKLLNILLKEKGYGNLLIFFSKIFLTFKTFI